MRTADAREDSRASAVRLGRALLFNNVDVF